jgi:O-antigen/teichoic acid export membrane protein
MPESRRTIAKDIWGTLFVQGASAALIFFSGLLLTRILSPIEFGAYDYIDVWVEILTFFALLGFDRLLILKIAVYIAENNTSFVRGIIRLAYLVSTSLSIIIGIGFCGITYFYFANYALDLDVLERVARLSVLPLVTILLVVRVLVKLNQIILQGFKQTVPAYLPDYLIRPLLLIVIIFGLWYTIGINAQEALYVHIFAAILCLILSLYLTRRLSPISLNHAEIRYQSSDWLKAALPFTLISALALLNQRGGGAILGTISTLETSALYSVAVRLTALVSLALTATSAVLAPRIAALYAQGKHEDLQRLVTFSTRMVSAVAIPMLLLMIVGGQAILGFFGEIYPNAYYALIVLCISQVIVAGTGVVGWVVIMTGHEQAMALILTLSAGLHIIGMLIFSPRFGLEGAALATAISNAFTNIALSAFSYYRLKINSTVF